MSLKLPAPIARYFATDSSSGTAVAGCFTPDAVVKDEGHTYKGTAAIAKWKDDASKKYQYTTEPFALEERDGQVIVTGHVAGNFPGSPVDLRYTFVLDGDRISALEITL
ncbi:nuclear transport factor 2 family protein [Chromatiaceae bacterium AAb-1]|nr:nuclear transport factor 2 family protein [Chromatiaceae bacterium AAb-1]